MRDGAGSLRGLVFRGLFPIPEVINILMRLPFSLNGGGRGKGEGEGVTSNGNRGTNNCVTRRRVLLLIHSTTEQPRDRAVRVASLDNRNSIKLLASGLFLRPKKGPAESRVADGFNATDG